MLEVKRIPTDNNLILSTDIVDIVLPPKLIDIDIYKEDKTLSIDKIVHLDYELSSYKGYKDKQTIYINASTPINREVLKVHTKEDTTVLEYKDMYISINSKLLDSNNNIPNIDNTVFSIDNTYNSKLVILIKEVI